MTIGYVDNKTSVPKSLLLGDNIDWSKAEPVDLILRRSQGAELFSEIVFGDTEALLKYKGKIEKLVSPEVFPVEHSIPSL